MYKVGDELKCSFKISGVCNFTAGNIYTIAAYNQKEMSCVIFDDNDTPAYFNLDELAYFKSIKEETIEVRNNGGSTDYYKLPQNAKDLQDLIEHKEMNFSLGNIFKAVYRLGNCSHSDAIRDLNKIIWFANREKERLSK